jgi:DNA-binding transcriptional LysR family regulator
MELRHLRYFVAVADELSFRGAARRLHVAQPSLGRQIRDLEEEIGERLFDRDRRQVALTDSGRVLLGEAKALLVAADNALQATRDAARGDRGLLRIGNIGKLSGSFLSRDLAAYRELYPRVDIQIVELGPDEQRAALREGTIEVGFLPTELDGQRADDLSSCPVLRSPQVVALPVRHRFAAERSITLSWLREERFLDFKTRDGSGYERWMRGLCRTFGSFDVRFVRPPVDNAETLFGLVAAGTGIVILPKVVVGRPPTNHGWVARPLRAPVPQFELDAVWRTGNASLLLKNYLRVLTRKAA